MGRQESRVILDSFLSPLSGLDSLMCLIQGLRRPLCSLLFALCPWLFALRTLPLVPVRAYLPLHQPLNVEWHAFGLGLAHVRAVNLEDAQLDQVFNRNIS